MRISAVLIDIDGVLTVSWQPLPGAVATLRQLRAAGLPLALVTNTRGTSDGLQLGSGAFVAGLEQAAGIEAEVVGKPAAAFFATALAHLSAAAAHTLMVGDDIETDVLAAQRQGLTGSWSKPASTCPAPTATPAARPTTSLAPSPICRTCWSTWHDRATANMCDRTRHDRTGQPVSVRASSDASRAQGLFSPFFSPGSMREEVRTMTAADDGHHPDGQVSRRGPARVDSSTRVNVALPFSQFKIQEPSDHLLALTALVEDLADLVADAVPGPKAKALRRRAHELASQAR